MAERRRLPVIQPPKAPDGARDAGGGDDDNAIEERPPWHWVGFGAVAIFAAWLPLAYAAQKIGERTIQGRLGAATEADIAAKLAALTRDELFVLFLPMALLHLLALAIAATAGGYLVGRFGSGTTAREPALAGGVVAFMAIMLTVGRGGGLGAVATGVVVVAIAVGGAALGGRRGLRNKEKSAPVARA